MSLVVVCQLAAWLVSVPPQQGAMVRSAFVLAKLLSTICRHLYMPTTKSRRDFQFTLGTSTVAKPCLTSSSGKQRVSRALSAKSAPNGSPRSAAQHLSVKCLAGSNSSRKDTKLRQPAPQSWSSVVRTRVRRRKSQPPLRPMPTHEPKRWFHPIGRTQERGLRIWHWNVVGGTCHGLSAESSAPIVPVSGLSLEDALATVTLFSTLSPKHGFTEQPAISGHRVQTDCFCWAQREICSKRIFSISKRRSYMHDSQRHLSGAAARTSGVLNEVLAPLRRQL